MAEGGVGCGPAGEPGRGAPAGPSALPVREEAKPAVALGVREHLEGILVDGMATPFAESKDLHHFSFAAAASHSRAVWSASKLSRGWPSEWSSRWLTPR